MLVIDAFVIILHIVVDGDLCRSRYSRTCVKARRMVRIATKYCLLLIYLSSQVQQSPSSVYSAEKRTLLCRLVTTNERAVWCARALVITLYNRLLLLLLLLHCQQPVVNQVLGGLWLRAVQTDASEECSPCPRAVFKLVIAPAR
jgi:hypothetical protein